MTNSIKTILAMGLFFSSSVMATVTEKRVGTFKNRTNFTIVCDGQEFKASDWDNNLYVMRVSTNSQIKYEIYSKYHGYVIMVCNSYGLK